MDTLPTRLRLWLLALCTLVSASQELTAVNVYFVNHTGETINNATVRGAVTGDCDLQIAGFYSINGIVNGATSGPHFVADTTWDGLNSSYGSRTGRAVGASTTYFSIECHLKTVHGDVYFTFGTPPPEACSVTFPYTNQTLKMRRAYWAINGVNIYVEDIPPGESRTHTLTAENCETDLLELYDVALMLNEDFELVPSTNVLATATNIEGESTNAATAYYFPPFEIDAPAALDSTNGRAPVIFSAAAGTNSSRAIQEGLTGAILSQQQSDGELARLLDAIRQNTQITATNTTPNIPETSEMEATGSGSAAGWSNAITGFADDFTLSTEVPTSIPSLEITIGTTVIDLNPMSIPLVADAAAAINAFLVWGSSILFVFAILAVIRQQSLPVFLAPQASAASATPLASSGSALVMAGLVAAVIGGSVVGLLAYIVAHDVFDLAMAQPFGNGLWATSMGLFSQIVPVSHLLGLLVSYWVFVVVVQALVTGAVILIRFFVGCLALGFFATAATAAEVRLSNLTETNLAVGALIVPMGTHWMTLPAAAYTLDDGDGTATLTVPAGDVTIQTAAIWSTGSGPALTEASADLLEGFWLGMGTAATFWLFGIARGLLFKLRGTSE